MRRDVQAFLGERFLEFLSASAILRHHFHNGKCSGQTLFNTIVAANNRIKMIATLFSHDADGDGFLTENQTTEALMDTAGACDLLLSSVHAWSACKVEGWESVHSIGFQKIKPACHYCSVSRIVHSGRSEGPVAAFCNQAVGVSVCKAWLSADNKCCRRTGNASFGNIQCRREHRHRMVLTSGVRGVADVAV